MDSSLADQMMAMDVSIAVDRRLRGMPEYIGSVDQIIAHQALAISFAENEFAAAITESLNLSSEKSDE